MAACAGPARAAWRAIVATGQCGASEIRDGSPLVRASQARVPVLDGVIRCGRACVEPSFAFSVQAKRNRCRRQLTVKDSATGYGTYADANPRNNTATAS